LIYSVGYADGADGINAGIPSGQIEIMPTLAGDAKMQGNVVFGDFQLLSQYFSQTGTSWDEGNFTYGSTTNFGDFQLLSQNFGHSASLAAGSALTGLGAAATPAASKSANASSASAASTPIAAAPLPSTNDDIVNGIWAVTAGTDDSSLFSDAMLQDVGSVLD
jgi:hypothetical protein